MERRSATRIWRSPHAADAILLAAVGGPKWDGVPYEVRPEAGLLRLRKELGLYANLRPAICYPALASASSLKPEVVEGLDIMIVRELTGGVYFGEPKQIIDLGNGQQRAIDTQVYDTYEIERIGRTAFELARNRANKVTSADKRNVMKSGVLWNEVMTALHKREYSDVKLEHQLADALGMQLVRWPKQFDVIVTDNLFGDMLSDVAAMLTGSLGMLPSASLGDADPRSGRRKALYEPVHGSAPDIAGKGVANPIAMIGSFGMALRYSFGLARGRRPARRGHRRRACRRFANRRHPRGRGRDGVDERNGRRDREGAGAEFGVEADRPKASQPGAPLGRTDHPLRAVAIPVQFRATDAALASSARSSITNDPFGKENIFSLECGKASRGGRRSASERRSRAIHFAG